MNEGQGLLCKVLKWVTLVSDSNKRRCHGSSGDNIVIVLKYS